MLKNGTYAAWFRTSLADGTGIVHMADGRLWGSDAIMLYSGTYEVDGERFDLVVLGGGPLSGAGARRRGERRGAHQNGMSSSAGRPSLRWSHVTYLSTLIFTTTRLLIIASTPARISSV